MYRIFAKGKQGFDALMKDVGRIVAEAIMYIDREEIAGHDYRPYSPNIRKWASQPGSVYIGDQKVPVEHPRLRGRQGEIALKSYERLKEPDGFSEELLTKVLRGISCQKYAKRRNSARNLYISVVPYIKTETYRSILQEVSERSASQVQDST